MDYNTKWQQDREEWLKPTNPYKQTDIYKSNDIDLELLEGIRDIIESTKGPYPAFEKKIPLSDLLYIARQVFEDDD